MLTLMLIQAQLFPTTLPPGLKDFNGPVYIGTEIPTGITVMPSFQASVETGESVIRRKTSAY